MELLSKLESRQARIGVVGMGYVGLPLALEFAGAGFAVTGIDLSEDKVARLRRGECYIPDVQEKMTAAALARFEATTDFAAIAGLDAVCICVPTPLTRNQEPDLSCIASAVEQLGAYLKPGALVVLESTTYPGTTDELVAAALAPDGRQAGRDFFLCYSPERVDPGNKTFRIRNTPKVVGGSTPRCLELGVKLYETIVERVVPVSSTRAAEMSKLLENTFRSVNIAFINEIAQLCDRIEVNVWEVIQAAATKPFGFMPFYPGPGIGGHCIPLDPMYLSWKAKGENFFSRFIELSQDLNRNMPRYVVQKTADLLNRSGKSVKNSGILLLGMAYKPDVGDWRESPSLEIYDLLHEKGARLTVHDPHCAGVRTEKGHRPEQAAELDPHRLASYDCILLLTAHSAFDLGEIARSGVPVLDTRNAFSGYDAASIVRIGDAMPGLDGRERALAIV
ncbi:nucleotide sugar dehydrogenase [Paenibacillus sp. B01]|uniref:nucleotide sugar dehydrogenase n=1 Tax=Paenibacillus sp. B01 TaxID=2660554 RepID=UPI00129A4F4C|nr:nucleotide sugar dehydrogenase [Paenibacillus sp. B01]QGG55166.1 nucleotide sugar dehydrogenase [Paenibacillus sp. B01]